MLTEEKLHISATQEPSPEKKEMATGRAFFNGANMLQSSLQKTQKDSDWSSNDITDYYCSLSSPCSKEANKGYINLLIQDIVGSLSSRKGKRGKVVPSRELVIRNEFSISYLRWRERLKDLCRTS